MEIVFAIHLFTTIIMTGICWFVQIVHYPLFNAIDLEVFPSYEKKNIATAYITVPTMTVEVITGLYLLYEINSDLYLYNLLLLALIWLSTIIFQVPVHLKLMKKPTPALISKLIKTNWIRTICWTLRSVLLMYILSI